MVTVEAVFIELVQVHIVQAGAAVQHAVIDHETLEVQHAEQLAGLHRHAVHRYFGGVALSHRLVPGAVARLLARADQPALGAQPINHHHDVQFGPCGLGGMQRVVDFLPRLILLQVQGNDVDTPRGLGDFLQQAATVGVGAGQHFNGLVGQRETAQLGQQGAFEERRHRARNGSNPKRPKAYTMRLLRSRSGQFKKPVDHEERSFYCAKHERYHSE